jgi:hypothetical protein
MKKVSLFMLFVVLAGSVSAESAVPPTPADVSLLSCGTELWVTSPPVCHSEPQIWAERFPVYGARPLPFCASEQTSATHI